MANMMYSILLLEIYMIIHISYVASGKSNRVLCNVYMKRRYNLHKNANIFMRMLRICALRLLYKCGTGSFLRSLISP